MPIARLYARGAEGRLEDLQHDIDLSECAGVCPMKGDHIVASKVGQSGTLWEVQERYFKARGHDDYVVLIVEERDARPDEVDLF
ncbi:hypothetical protein HZ989_07310 [Brevundimonas sp. AJA228-03]|uniref:hypothetical protein n=1 Tax=Brevundimonas sp. AJA228-03 TaxID=2752515 RepID=UPI001AE0D86A|nr:hypothetical protein [Brevundimonas sp. AJA228-03]QTN20844.1 hypothetical protein HZ989_07310 [Brevundimonas sp. AJA228-03]